MAALLPAQTRDDGAAIEPPAPPKLVRVPYDGVEDADYEEVRSSGIPPVGRDDMPRSFGSIAPLSKSRQRHDRARQFALKRR